MCWLSLQMLLPHCVLANANAIINDSISDSIDKNYHKIDSALFKVAKKSKVTYWLFSNIYEMPSNDKIIKDDEVILVPKDVTYKYQGKVIRKIIVKSLDPFGTDVEDTLIKRRGQLADIGNAISFSTRTWVIRNLLLFKTGERLDALSIRESERLLRTQNYIRDARIFIPNKSKLTNDSVDIIVVVQERFALNASFTSSTNQGEIQLYQNNFFGTGNKIRQGGKLDYNNLNLSSYNGEFKNVNIYKTYIDASLFYDVNPYRKIQGFLIDRTFFSPLTKWAGSLSRVMTQEKSYYDQILNKQIPVNIRYNTTDIWLGRSIPLSNGNDEAFRSSSLVIAGRYSNTRFIQRDTTNLAPIINLNNKIFYLGSVGFSSRRYYKDRKLFRFGNTEDIPEGRSFSFVGGFLDEGSVPFYYTGIKFSSGQHIENIGYLAGSIEYGTFYSKYIAQRGVLTIDGSYFSDLWKLHTKWTMRQFIYAKMTNGLNREANELVNLNGSTNDGLYGFQSNLVEGRNKFILKFESIIYTPFNYAGTNIAAVVFAGFGMVSNQIASNVSDRTIYQAYGLGFLIRKENLVVNTIRLSIGFYPNIPFNSGNDYRFNPYSISQFNLRDFDVSKPQLATYR
jgi:hypothetical protein